MRYKLTILFLCFIVTGIISAQDSELTPYEIALERIQQAEASGATGLYLSFLALPELPSEIGNLSSLEFLDLSNNQLNSLPPEIGNLSSLEFLDLRHNQLSSLPPEIDNLENLQLLDLGDNQLTQLPSEIGNLQNLQWFDLGFNQLTRLPSEIVRLQNLQLLGLHSNQLSSLPQDIGQLTNLCSLGLIRNQLQSLPHDLGQLSRLASGADCPYQAGLYLHDNPLISPPDEVLAQGTEAVLAYLRNEAWWHLQRLIVSISGGIGLIIVAILGLRWRNQRGKRKRKNDELVTKS